MDNNILVTIGVLTYNQEDYIIDTLKSIIDQTYQNIELIILDDNSKDNTVCRILSIENNLKSRFSTYKLIIHDNNSGNISKNCNEILKHAKGDFFKILGGDDMLLPDYFMTTINALENYPCVNVLFTDVYKVDGNYKLGYRLKKTNRFVNRMIPKECDKMYHELLYGNFLPAPGFVFRTDALRDIEGFDEDFEVEDYAMWLKLSSHGVNFKYIDEPLVLYRVSNQSLSLFSGDKKENRIRKFENICDNELRLFDKYLSSVSRDQYIKYMGILIENMALLCCRIDVPEESAYLDLEAEKRGLPVSASTFINDNSQISVLNKWQDENSISAFISFLENNNIKTISVYGYGARGRRVVEFLEKNQIEVSFLIDRAGQNLTSECKIYKPDDKMPEVDAVIVSPYQVLDDNLRNKLKCNGCKKVFELENIIYNEHD